MTRFPVLKPHRLPFFPGMIALVFEWLSLTPSLLPRPALFQGLTTAVAALMGYGLGALLAWTFQGISTGTKVKKILLYAAVPISVVMIVLSYLWQQSQRDLLGMSRLNAGFIPLWIAVATLILALLLILSRAMKRLMVAFGSLLGRFLPKRASTLIGALLAAWRVVGFTNGYIVDGAARLTNQVFSTLNDETYLDEEAPTVPELSGNPSSLSSWESLGQFGRQFVLNAPAREQIAAFTGQDAMQPIRAYVGLSDKTPEERADIAVAELEQMGAFDRSVLNVAMTTGRGWLNENQVQALEYMWGGDTATVTIQYSYLPSWMSYLAAGHQAPEAGTALFEAVYEHWNSLPQDQRPLLVVSGESLGSFGSESSFRSAQDLANRTDGGLYVGPAAMNPNWQTFVADRDAGSPAYLPVYDGGEVIRFSRDGAYWPGDGEWTGPRIGYLQHDNDPVTWFDASLTFSKPDWLKAGQRGAYIPDQMIWIPGVTMLQVGIDQLYALETPDQGHNFGQNPAVAWAHILPPAGWGEADTGRLVTLLHKEIQE